jgi:phenylalanyl-tRNA synthetase beta subunit
LPNPSPTALSAKDACDRLNLPENDERRKMLDILNPISEDQSVMRTSLIPGLLEAMTSKPIPTRLKI